MTEIIIEVIVKAWLIVAAVAMVLCIKGMSRIRD
jgi:hypothetical protein